MTVSLRLATCRQKSSAVSSSVPPEGRLRIVSAMRARSRVRSSARVSSSRSWLTSRASSTNAMIDSSTARMGEMTEVTLYSEPSLRRLVSSPTQGTPLDRAAHIAS